ncbi:hypothetical protein CC86DRAFT_426156 [Ophiobolus disseminans]|uniref:ABM domain-containing protein n=1 Tax=Ophiobolus disseminans TaxID=1469910 RepID=A0A6A6ZMY6_9PLEO|nr:hypothetical protein CC86DRAFT_426156 [Ophiobolus disseminans]
MGSIAHEDEQILVLEHWMPQPGKLEQETKDGGNAAVVTASHFNSRKTYEKYLSSAIKSTINETCNEQNLIREPPRQQILKPVAGFPLRSNNDNAALDNMGGYVAMAKIDYVPGTRIEGIKHWRAVAASVEEHEKEGTHTYWFLADPEHEDVLYTLERYRDEKYLWDVHVPSDAIQENKEKQKDIRTGLLLRCFESVGY